MKKLLLTAGAAALVATMPALADPGQGKGKGNGAPDRVERQNKGAEKRFEQAAKRAEKRNEQAARRSEQRREQASKVAEKHRERAAKVAEKRYEQAARENERRFERAARSNERRTEQLQRLGDRDRWEGDGRWDGREVWARSNGFCPPGLAKRNNGCMPPGQARKIFSVGERLRSEWYRDYMPAGYRSLYYDTPEYYYRYDDGGYIYRVDRDTNLVSSLIPLLGGGFGVGQALPSGYDIYNVPIQYRDVYYDTPDAYYRYGDNAIYQVDPQTQMIESVVALLAGDALGIGQVLPAGYDAYNVPLDYRDRYYDTDEYMYRYADGYIYQVDPQTQIIQAIISALV